MRKLSTTGSEIRRPVRQKRKRGKKRIVFGKASQFLRSLVATAAFVSWLVSNSDAQELIFQNRHFDCVSNPQAVASADFNGDGIVDLCFAGSNGQISVHLGIGSGCFASPQNVAVGSVLTSIICDDFDGDGVVDLAATSHDLDNVSVLIGTGDGRFGRPASFATGERPFAIASADFNGDNHIDFAIANRESDDVSILLGNGDATFSAAQQFMVGESPTGIVTEDFNGDSAIDVAVVNGSSDDVSVLLGVSDGSFLPEIRVGAAFRANSITSGDFDGDGVQDLAFGVYNAYGATDSVGVLIGFGDGMFSGPDMFDTGPFTQTVQSIDFDGDGFLDLVTINSDGNATINDGFVLLGNGDGDFAVGRRISVAYRANDLAIEDFDGDGNFDIATVEPTATYSSVGRFSVLLGCGSTELVPGSENFPAGDSPGDIVAADIDGDGIVDLVTGNSNIFYGFPGDGISVLLGQPNGSFLPTMPIETENAISSIVAADFNGDGIVDLAGSESIPYLGSDLVLVWLGTGDGRFIDAPSIKIGNRPVVGDFNGDSNVDLVGVSNGVMTVTLGNGDGTFVTVYSFDFMANNVLSIAVADLDGDGIEDISVPKFSEDEVAVVIGNGDGTFGRESTFSVGDSPQFIAVGDINGDEIPDLVTANRQSDDVSILTGIGDGEFGDLRSCAVGNSPRMVSFGDFNRDGSQDIAAVNFFSHDVSVILGNGDGTFLDAQHFSTGSRPSRLEIEDLNGDGLEDIATSNPSTDQITVLTNLVRKNRLIGDINLDGVVGLLDIDPFVKLLSNSEFQVEADINGDGAVDLLDVHPFVGLLGDG